MRDYTAEEVQTLSEAFAFVGNSLLKPINQTPTAGLDPAFWAGFPDFGDAAVRDAVEACGDFAAAQPVGEDGLPAPEAVTAVSVEYTRLFIGPPKPAAAPWETAYRGGGGVGFGQPTFEMRALLREAGLEMAGESNQYADHMGIELLLLAVLLHRAVDAADAADAAGGEAPDLAQAAAFACGHPADWVAAFHARVHGAAPGGYHDRLLALAEALLGLLESPDGRGSDGYGEEEAHIPDAGALEGRWSRAAVARSRR